MGLEGDGGGGGLQKDLPPDYSQSGVVTHADVQDGRHSRAETFSALSQPHNLERTQPRPPRQKPEKEGDGGTSKDDL